MNMQIPAVRTAMTLVLTGCAVVGLAGAHARVEAAETPSAAGVPVRQAEIAPVATWAGGRKPIGAEGTQVEVFAAGLKAPTQLQVLPNGDVLVLETNPPQPGKSLVRLLRDSDGDGQADQQAVLVDDLKHPMGMALSRSALFIVTADGLLKYGYREDQARIDSAAEVVAPVPASIPPWSGDLLPNRGGGKLYLALATDAAESDSEQGVVREINAEFGDTKYSSMLPQAPVGLAWELERGALWALLPSEGEQPLRLIEVSTKEDRKDPQPAPAELEAESSVAPSDLTNGFGNTLPARFAHGMFIGQHGAGTGTQIPEGGYEVLFVPFRAGIPEGQPVSVLSGFIDDDGNILGRPVAVAIDSHGALLVADDVGNVIWRVTSAPAAGAAP